MQNTSSQTLEKQLEKFNEERREMTQRLEKITIDMTKKDRQITSLEN